MMKYKGGRANDLKQALLRRQPEPSKMFSFLFYVSFLFFVFVGHKEGELILRAKQGIKSGPKRDQWKEVNSEKYHKYCNITR